MEAQEAKLYRGDEYIKSLCLIGCNDDFDEIAVEKDGTMTVRTFETIEKYGKYVDVEVEYKGITRINFK
jgi:hypothetical protein